MFNKKEALEKVPKQPGVYIMRDDTDGIIYIGKAIKLRNRVSQYFRESTKHTNKIRQMITQIARFEYIVTDSEQEALILESQLIKQHKPRYNTMLKDDKSYPYIKVTKNEPYPRIMITRIIKQDGAKYYGPYTSGLAAKEVVELMRKMYKIRNCNRRLPKDIHKERACLYYHIHQCEGPCEGLVEQIEYKKNAEKVVSFLDGEYEPVIKLLKLDMKVASDSLDFEKAAEIRDQLKSVEAIAKKQKIVDNSLEDKDVIGFAKTEKEAIFQVFFIRKGGMIGQEHYRLEGIEELKDSTIMAIFVKQFYAGTPYIPRTLMLQELMEEEDIIGEWLSSKRGSRVYLKTPKKGEKLKLIQLAKQNANIKLKQYGEKSRREEARTKGAVKTIDKLLAMTIPINRIEAYDISNTQGFESVGSMVVFEEGKPKRSDYRKFKIKQVQGPDDYASLREVLTRRFTRALDEQKKIILEGLDSQKAKFIKLPELILMDGGKGQVSIGNKVLNDLGLDIKVCGMIKDSKHRTKGLLDDGKEVLLDKHSEAFKLITRIQDEAHRFAIEYHKNLRNKKQIQSILDEIDGIGPARRRNLILHFGSVAHIREADIETLEKVDSMNKTVAEEVFNFFNNTLK